MLRVLRIDAARPAEAAHEAHHVTVDGSSRGAIAEGRDRGRCVGPHARDLLHPLLVTRGEQRRPPPLLLFVIALLLLLFAFHRSLLRLHSSRQLLLLLLLRGDAGSVLLNDKLGALVEEVGSPVVAHSRPHGAHRCSVGGGQRLDGGKGCHPRAPVAHNRRDLRLLRHHFRDPNGVGVGVMRGEPPRDDEIVVGRGSGILGKPRFWLLSRRGSRSSSALVPVAGAVPIKDLFKKDSPVRRDSFRQHKGRQRPLPLERRKNSDVLYTYIRSFFG